MRLADFVQRQNEKHAAILPPTMRAVVLAETAEVQAAEDADARAVAARLANDRALHAEVEHAEREKREALVIRERLSVDLRLQHARCYAAEMKVLRAGNALTAQLRALWPRALPRYRVEAAIALLEQEQERVESTRPQDVAAQVGRRTRWSTAGDAAGFHASSAAITEALDTLRGIVRGDREPVTHLDEYVERAIEQARGQRAA
jgi:hypothetical protein